MDTFHKPVMKEEVIERLQVKDGSRYIDATLGGGGHGFEILKKGGILLGLDHDQDAIEYVRTNNEERITKNELVLVRGNFSDIERIARENGFEKVGGVLFDLGMSSYQIEQSGRGFSFSGDEPLDMRMDTKKSLTASEIINNWTEGELYDLFSKMAEDPNSWAVARNIVRARRLDTIKTTGDLVRIIESAVRNKKQIHKATRIFQALRIAVNQELENLKKGLEEAFGLLQDHGRMVVVSYHSLEDRITKLYFLELERQGKALLIAKKPIMPTLDEIRENRRARSAKMRVVEKI